MKLRAIGWLCWSSWLAAHGVHAQEPPAAPAAPNDAQSESVAPQIETLPQLDLPDALEAPPGALEATLRIEVDGRATLIESTAQGDLRARIQALVDRARFTPARRGGVPIVALVRVRFGVSRPEPIAPSASTTTPEPAARVATPELAEDSPATEEVFGARAEIDPPKPAARELELEEMRELPGAFGDPFRVLDTLPGVVPVFSGLPYVYVRGSPPAGTIYVYDGITVPALFHLALGPAVVHPAMIGDLSFYSAVAPARYGRHTGGVFAAEGPEPGDGTLGGEVELRLLDANAMLDVPIGESQLIVAGRYGYPGLLLSIFSPESVLAYWDYQLRFRQPMSASDRIELTWFGSYDLVGEKENEDDNLSLEFHRIEARVIRELSAYEIGFGLQGGYEQSSLGDTVQVSAYRVGPRLWSEIEVDTDARVRLGADMLASFGSIDESEEEEEDVRFDPPAPELPPNLNPAPTRPDVPPIGGSEEDDSFFDDPISAVPGRSQAGVYAELDLGLGAGWGIQPGLRFDTWITGSDARTALEPRLIVSWQSHEWLRLHAASGLGHQLATFPIPLPGFNDLALAQGLQRAIHNEVGAALTPTESLRVEADLYYTRMTDLLMPMLFFRCDDDFEDDSLCEAGRVPRADADVYGLELFIKREQHEVLSGWLSYTLGWAQAETRGIEFTPEFDVRHIANLVLQLALDWGVTIGSRLHYRTGKVASQTLIVWEGTTLPYPMRIEHRLPGFFRVDARLSHRWSTDWGRMQVTIEWMNVTMSREPTGIDCEQTDPRNVQCNVDYAPAIFFPNLGVRAEF